MNSVKWKEEDENEMVLINVKEPPEEGHDDTYISQEDTPMYKFKPPMNDIKFTERDDDSYLASTYGVAISDLYGDDDDDEEDSKQLTRVVHI